jgi:hypothetical protein
VSITVTTAEELIPELLGQLLGQSVTDVVTEPLGVGNMSGSYRLMLSYRGGSVGPQTVIAKIASEVAAVREANATTYRTEVGFYTELAHKLDVESPACYHADFAEDGSFLLLLEDLHPAMPGDQIRGCTAEQARAALVNLSGLHASSWQRDDLQRLPFLTPMAAGAADAIGDVLVATTPAFVDRFSTPAQDAEILTTFARSASRWVTGRAERFALLHNDYRLDNLLFDSRPDSPRPVIAVDWAVLGAGLPGRDVAFFLATGLEPEQRRRYEHELVAAYNQSLNRSRRLQTQEESFSDYVYGLFQAVLVTVLGAMMSQRSARGDEMFSVMIRRACAAIRDLHALDVLPR